METFPHFISLYGIFISVNKSAAALSSQSRLYNITNISIRRRSWKRSRCFSSQLTQQILFAVTLQKSSKPFKSYLLQNPNHEKLLFTFLKSNLKLSERPHRTNDVKHKQRLFKPIKRFIPHYNDRQMIFLQRR